MHVLLADDEPKVRSALRLILEQLKEVETVDEVTDARALTERIRTTPPDLLLVDWELPGLHQDPSISEMRRHWAFKVIVMSGRCTVPPKGLYLGADAFVSKCESPERLFATLRAMGAD
jgi:DNA-binding NarL/FixJ family response regulator